MKTHKIKNLVLLIAITLIFLMPVKAFGIEGEIIQTVSKDKIWSINFNEATLLDEVNADNVYILDDKEQKVDVTLELDKESKVLLLKPPSEGYEVGRTYILEITDKVQNPEYVDLKQPVSFKFIIENPVYIVNANNINLSIKQGQAFTFQKKVTVDLSNGEKNDRDVVWDSIAIDTTKVGTYNFKGTVEGYDSKINLTVNVMLDYNYLVKPSIVTAELNWDSYFYNDMSLKSKKLGMIKKGSKVEVIRDKSYQWYYIRSKEGTCGWISATALIISKDPVTNTSKLTKKEAEGYINLKKFSSSSKYFLWVDISRQTVNVFEGTKEKYKLTKTMSCATGKNVSPTARGTFTIQTRGTWFFKGSSGAKNWVQFNGAYLFHSVVMNENKTVKDNTIGKRASAGCIRLSENDSKWIYDNITNGTTVWVN
ncbi:L,D-transpeptidase family protein [Clostridium sp. CS001]|uniref:L,D-transpeptidase family protein n=1 Tax=Clostridium sp. CS001 TaxID=2880648 RepID=UPI001CF3FBE2|nr:L,D-transpeptidase family protein [Clostridium sp. CS001]MCB2289735.1 L,D-transpeptidase family protein [Clostridium sp. CS001]